jgi:hypothetical protein
MFLRIMRSSRSVPLKFVVHWLACLRLRFPRNLDNACPDGCDRLFGGVDSLLYLCSSQSYAGILVVAIRPSTAYLQRPRHCAALSSV